MPHKLCHSLDGAAIELGVGKSHLRKYIDSGDLPSFKFGKRRLISHESLQKFVHTLEQSGYTPAPEEKDCPAPEDDEEGVPS